jgi:putative transposase
MRDPTVERTSVAVRYDPFDVTVGFAWINKQWRKCICPVDELARCSERELQLLAAAVRQQNRLLYGKAQVEITQKQLADFRRKNAAKEVILRKPRHDRETQAALSILEGRGAPLALPVSVTEEPPPDEGHEPLKFPARHTTSDGDTLRVLRRLR